jgi:hypothetical protein
MAMQIDTKQQPNAEKPAMIVDEQLYCSLTGKPIHPEEAYWAPPLITFRELVTTVSHTMMHTPNELGQVLFGEQPNVPYAQDSRDLLARRRSSEQIKLLIGLLIIAAVIATPIFLIAMR